MQISLADIEYELPSECIAQSAVEPRDSARLLVCDHDGGIRDARFSDLPAILHSDDLLVGNHTRVRRARLGVRRMTGGACELLFLRPCRRESPDGWWEVLARPSRRIRVGERLAVETDGSQARHLSVEADATVVDATEVEVGRLVSDGRREARAVGGSTEAMLERYGVVPLPPYFAGSLLSPERYQTVFAETAGSAAAPTAGLHFTEALLDELAGSGVRFESIELDIGVDTFRPVTAANPLEHPMHSEAYRIGGMAASEMANAKSAGRAVIAVGTTTTRGIESAAIRDASGAPTGDVRVGAGCATEMISAGHEFLIDGLITNFHSPRSTLLLLLGAIFPAWRDAYEHALCSGYRFLSFGDATLVLPSGRKVSDF